MSSDVDFDAVSEALGLLASAVKSGEPWTDICEQKYKAALSCLHKVAQDQAVRRPLRDEPVDIDP